MTGIVVSGVEPNVPLAMAVFHAANAMLMARKTAVRATIEVIATTKIT